MSGCADPSLILRALTRAPVRVGVLLATLGAIVLSTVAPTAAGAHGFPVPSCTWVSPALLAKTIGERVRALSPSWSSVKAPVLTCGYVERVPQLQFTNAPIVSVRFAETQSLPRGRRSKSVGGLGHCAGHAACHNGAKPADLSVTYVLKRGLYSFRYISVVDLRVQDGLDAIEITVVTPNGPAPVFNEVSRIEGLMRLLLPRFSVR